MVSASGSGGGDRGTERRAGCRRRARNGVRAVIEENRLLLLGRDLLNRDTSAATFAIHRVVTNGEGIFCMGPEDCRFRIADGSRTRDVSCIGEVLIVRPTGRDDPQGRGQCS